MKTVRGIIKATGSALSVGIGFKPDFVNILNGNDRTGLDFNSGAISQQPYGQAIGADGVRTDAASGAGVTLYTGNVGLSAASTVELRKNDDDQKGTITKWSTTTAATKKGKFDAALDTTKVGVGSRVVFADGTIAVITALDNDGDADDDVTLDVLPGSVHVCKIYGMYDYMGGAAGDAIPQGFTIGASATVNDNGDVLQFVAGCYD